MIREVLVLAFVALTAAGQVVQIEEISNIASGVHRALPNGGIAAGSRFIIKGRNLGPDQTARATSYPLPVSLGGTTVRFRNIGAPSWTTALLLRTSAQEIVALLPNSATPGASELEVTVNGQAGRTVTFPIVERSFGIFTRSDDGIGPAVARSGRTMDFVHVLDAALPGDTITLFGTGLGAVDGDESRAPVTGNFAVQLEVWAGGKPVEVRYAGRSSDSPGVDHIVFTLPFDVGPGCYVSVVVRHGGIVSNFSSLPIASSSGPCSDAAGATAAELTNSLRSSDGFYNWGAIHLTRRVLAIPGAQGTVDEGAAEFRGAPFDNYSAMTGPLQLPSPGSCSVESRYAQRESEFDALLRSALEPPIPALPPRNPRATPPDVPLEAGSFLELSGPPGGKQIRLTGTSYFARLGGGSSGPLYLDAGRYTVRAPGGFLLGAFTADASLSPPFSSDSGTAESPLDGNPVITWSGGDPAGTVTISGLAISAVRGGEGAMAALFHCAENAAAGSFTIPESVLSSLTVAPDAQSAGFLSVMGSTAPVRFTARNLHTGLLFHNQTNTQLKVFHAP